jgi:hypothetical protein
MTPDCPTALVPGFVWRLQDESGNATGIRTTSDPLFAVNMSVWENAEALFAFVYRSAHTPVIARRREFFLRLTREFHALSAPPLESRQSNPIAQAQYHGGLHWRS